MRGRSPARLQPGPGLKNAAQWKACPSDAANAIKGRRPAKHGCVCSGQAGDRGARHMRRRRAPLERRGKERHSTPPASDARGARPPLQPATPLRRPAPTGAMGVYATQGPSPVLTQQHGQAAHPALVAVPGQRVGLAPAPAHQVRQAIATTHQRQHNQSCSSRKDTRLAHE
jgi:hypothetical protein